jgi:RHS repeat-associated protein
MTINPYYPHTLNPISMFGLLLSLLRGVIAYSRLIPLFIITLITICIFPSAQAGEIRPGFDTFELARNDDGSSSAITLDFTVNFFGENFNQVYVNNNGNLTFGHPLSEYSPKPLDSAGLKIIAPFWADVDTRSPSPGLTKYGTGTVNERIAFGVTWIDVGYYNHKADKLNSFQVILVDRSDLGPGDFDIEFNYDKIQWETGDASEGSQGFGGYSAHAGYSNGSDVTEILPGSGINGALLDGGPNSLVANRSKFSFVVRGGKKPEQVDERISLEPDAITSAGGTNHTVIAKLMDYILTKPIAGREISFEITEGPNVGTTETAITDANGQAFFSYTANKCAGTDKIQAKFVDSVRNVKFSNPVTRTTVPTVPIARFTVPESGFIHQAVNLDASSSTAYCGGGSITSYQWQSADGQTIPPGAISSVIYVQAGTYTLTLTVTDNLGAIHSMSQTITISVPPPPVARAVVSPLSGNASLTVALDGSSSSAYNGGNITKYEWQSSDGQPIPAGATSSITYTQPGQYQITLTVTDNLGGTHSTQQTITVTISNQDALTVFLKRLGAESVNLENRRLSFVITGETHSGLLAEQINSGTSPGDNLLANPIGDANNDGIEDLLIAYPSGDQQVFYYFGTNTESALLTALRRYFESFGAEAVVINTDGSVFFTLEGKTYQGQLAAETRAGTPPSDGFLILTPIGDANADGINDYEITYPNGTRQTLYSFFKELEIVGPPPLPNNKINTPNTIADFIYNDDDNDNDDANPIQTDVDPGTIDPDKLAVLRGKVTTRDKHPLTEVTIALQNHPEFGQTRTQSDGTFSLVVNGGESFTLKYTKPGYLSAQRQVNTQPKGFFWAEDVVMIPRNQGTFIDLSDTNTKQMQSAQGPEVTSIIDLYPELNRPPRQATMFFPQGTLATLSDGTRLESFEVQITEYTVNDNDLAAMPTPLPPNTGYTYAVNLSANGRTDVRFNRMIPFYLTNFLYFPVGSVVPVGRLDENSNWVPVTDGRVIKVLSTDNGIAAIDTNGDGLPDDELRITLAEKQEIAKQFQAGSEFLRIEVNQLGNYDLNWPLRTPPKPAVKPGSITPTANEVAEKPTLCSGCTIDAESQVLKQAIPLTGVPFNLNYRSNRTPGRTANYQVNIPLQDQVQTPKRILLEVSLAGQKISHVFSDNPSDKPIGPLGTPNYTYEWDGKDAYGRPLQGKGRHEATVRIGYVYDGIYEVPPEVSQTLIDSGVVQCTETGTTAPNDERGRFGCINATEGISLGIPARQEITGWQEYTINIGAWIPRAFELGGWTLDIHHTYDPNDEVLHRGDGRQRQVAPLKRQDNLLIASEDAGVVYEFNQTGTHLRTLDSLTGKTIYEFAYSENGYLVEITDIDGNLTVIERDADDNPLAIIAPSGQPTELSLDTNGYLASVRNPLNEVHQMLYTEGLLTEYTDPRGNVANYQYNDNGLFVENTDPAEGGWKLEENPENTGYTVTLKSREGRVSRAEITKSEDGTLKQVNTAPDGTQTTITQKTADNQKVTLNIERADGTKIRLQQGPEQRFQMQSPLPESLTIATPNELEFTAATARIPELADENDPLSLTKLTETVSINGRTSTSVYEKANNQITTTSAEGRQTVSHLDDNGRLIREQTPGLEDVHYQYDNQGRLLEIRVGDGAEARTTQISYNNTNSISQITDALGRQVTFSYDKANRVSTIILADGREIKYGYDENSNLTEITSPGRPTQTFDYTDVNLPAQYTPASPEQQTRYEYNKDQQLTQIIRPNEETVDLLYNDVTGRLNTIKFPNGDKSYLYDSKGNTSRILLSPDNSTLNYSYDGFLPLSETSGSGNIIGRVTNTYDNNFQVIATSINGSHTVNYRYDNDGLLIEAGFLKLYFGQNGLLMVTQLGSVSTQRTHSGFLDEIETETATHNNETLYHVEYRYDKGGRITEKAETLAGEQITYTYKYDQAGRLSEVSEDGILTEQYRYDNNDNRLSADTADGFVEGQYDAQQRLTEYGDTTYEYTANGELRRKNQTGAITEYEYDVFSNLRAVKLPDKQIEYLIDGKDRRIAKLVDGELTQGFLYQGSQNPIAELDTSGNVVTRFVYGSKTNVPDYLIKDDKIYRILSDPLGSPRLVVDIHDGSIVQRLDYNVFGKVTQDTQPGFQPFGFAGGLYDADTGLVRFGVRDYDAETGRWTTLEKNARVSAYALNNPIEQLAKLSPSPTRFLELQVNIISRLFTRSVRKAVSRWENEKREGLKKGVRMTQDDLNQLSEDVAKFNGSSTPLPSSSTRLNNWDNPPRLIAQLNNVMEELTRLEAKKQERIAKGLMMTPEQFRNFKFNF